MFKGKIRKCLKCGEVPQVIGPTAIMTCNCLMKSDWGGKIIDVINAHNFENATPEEIINTRYHYAFHNLELP